MSNILFVVAQGFGVAGLAVLLISFHVKKKQKLLHLQMVSSLLYLCQYLCLGAFSGLLTNLFALIRNFLYSRFKVVPKYLVVIALVSLALLGYFSYSSPIGLLPIFATVCFTIGLASKKLYVARIADIIACSLYIIYNINVGAYVGVIATVIEGLNSAYALYRYDLKKLKKHTKSASRHAHSTRNL